MEYDYICDTQIGGMLVSVKQFEACGLFCQYVSTRSVCYLQSICQLQTQLTIRAELTAHKLLVCLLSSCR